MVLAHTKCLLLLWFCLTCHFLRRYSYYENWNLAGPVQPSVDWLHRVNRRNHKTNMFTGVADSVLLSRRDGEITFVISCPTRDGVLAKHVSASISGWVGEQYRFSTAQSQSLDQTTTNSVYPQGEYTVSTTQDGDTRVVVRLALASTAPVGVYRLSVEVRVNETSSSEKVQQVTYSRSTALVVLFNPFGKRDDVRQSRSNVAEYVENTEGLIWQGTSDNNMAHVWAFTQFEWQQLEVSLDCLRRMPLSARGDAALVSRHLTYALNEDICYGKWSGSYTSGKPFGGYPCSKSKSSAKRCYDPEHWTGTAELFAAYIGNGGLNVQYCQCFVYAGLFTTIGRALGIPTRPVTNFQSAHDTTRDRAVSKYYDIEKDTGVFVPVTETKNLPDDAGHDSIWSFHVWNSMYMRRPVLNKAMGCKRCADGWQALDATPQEFSLGGDPGLPSQPDEYMGPAAIRGVVRKNLDPVCRSQTPQYGCFDSQFVISEVNADILIRTRKILENGNKSWELYGCDTQGQNCGFHTDPFGDPFNTVGLQISTKKKGPISDRCRRGLSDEEPRDCSKELDDVTSSYKRKEPSAPGEPTQVSVSSRRQLNGIQLSNVAVGLSPRASGPVINEPGHPASSVMIGVRWDNVGVDVSSMMCALTVTVRDYTSSVLATVYTQTIAAEVHSQQRAHTQKMKLHLSGYTELQIRNAATGKTASRNGLNKGDVANVLRANDIDFVNTETSVQLRSKLDQLLTDIHASASQTFTTPETAGCTFGKVNRSVWRQYAATYMDTQDGFSALDPSEQAYLLHFEITVSAKHSDGPRLVLVEERSKVICTPLVGLSLKKKIICADKRGQWLRPPEDNSAVAHLTKTSCVDAGVSGSKWARNGGPNDGICNAANNVDGCWDGGDCCSYSCFEKQGQFVKLKDGGGWEHAHRCYEVRDDTTCKDPAFRANFKNPPLDFEKPVPSDSFAVAPNMDQDQCAAIVADLDGRNRDCDALFKFLCGDSMPVARLVAECRAEISASAALSSCGMPRCAPRTRKGCRCQETWSYTNKTGQKTTFTNHRCGNPFDESWWANDWCNIVPGSCTEGSAEGYPGDAADYFDNSQGSWYDNCGTRTVDTTTGTLRPLTSWTSSEVVDVHDLDVEKSMAKTQVALQRIINSTDTAGFQNITTSATPTIQTGAPATITAATTKAVTTEGASVFNETPDCFPHSILLLSLHI